MDRDRHKARGGLSRDSLESLVARGLTLREIAAEVDRSAATVRYWLGKYGLKTRRHHGNRRRHLALAALASGERQFEGVCQKHGTGRFLVFADGTSRCARCNSEHVTDRRRRAKRQLVAEAGGACVLCGYNRYAGALQFHHRDPAMKEFPVSQRGASVAIARSRAEAQKCALLCANCHAEVEGGVASLT